MGTSVDDEKIFRVRSSTPTKDLGAAIAHAVYDGKAVVLRAVGHGATGQAGKGIAVAEGHAAKQAIHLKSNFGFFTTKMPDGKDFCGLVIRVVRD
jgi:stage V sporulation protein SpoVS